MGASTHRCKPRATSAVAAKKHTPRILQIFSSEEIEALGSSKIVIAESTAIGQSVLHTISLLARERSIEDDTQLYDWEKDLDLAIVEMERANAELLKAK